MLRYKEKESAVHKVDPRVKILWVLGVSSMLLVDKTFALWAFVILFAGYTAARISMVRAFCDLKMLVPFLLFPLVLHALADPGEVIMNMGAADVTLEGVYKGVQNTGALAALILCIPLLIYTTETKKIQQALYWFRIPAKIVFMLTITLRFLPLIHEELVRIRVAQAVRGHKAKSSVMPLILPLLHKSLARAWKLAVALETRGFDPDKIKVNVELEANALDHMLFALFIGLAGWLVYFK